jgi:hypothetical protein
LSRRGGGSILLHGGLAGPRSCSEGVEATLRRRGLPGGVASPKPYQESECSRRMGPKPWHRSGPPRGARLGNLGPLESHTLVRPLLRPLSSTGLFERADRGGCAYRGASSGRKVARATFWARLWKKLVWLILAAGSTGNIDKGAPLFRIQAWGGPPSRLRRGLPVRPAARAPGGRGRQRRTFCYLVDPASNHMLLSKIKPCMCTYKHFYGKTANGSNGPSKERLLIEKSAATSSI